MVSINDVCPHSHTENLLSKVSIYRYPHHHVIVEYILCILAHIRWIIMTQAMRGEERRMYTPPPPPQHEVRRSNLLNTTCLSIIVVVAAVVVHHNYYPGTNSRSRQTSLSEPRPMRDVRYGRKMPGFVGEKGVYYEAAAYVLSSYIITTNPPPSIQQHTTLPTPRISHNQ